MKDKSPQLIVSNHILNILAAIVWYTGGIVLLLKGSNLLIEADTIKPEKYWPQLAAITGLFFGSLKARFLFNKSCQKNLNRIAALNRPRIWQFFRIRFFVALIVMITMSVILSGLVHNNYIILISVAILDLSISIALLGSSYVFWKQRAFVK
ncbi:hypothetical protein ACFLZD_02750 [Candidatus Neomarinimicrobiota bacterium]